VTLAQAPPGYKIWENKLQRVAFYYPTVFAEMPLPPTEQLLVARYVLKDQPEEMRKVHQRVWDQCKPELAVFCFEQPGPTTGAKPEDEDEPGPGTLREAMEKQNRIKSWDEFVARYAQWDLTEDPKKPGFFDMRWKEEWNEHPERAPRPVGYLVRKQEGTTVFGVYGITFATGKKTMVGQVQKVAAGLRLATPDSAATEKAEADIDKVYATGKFRDVEGRKRARSALAKGWKALDTENYLIVHHSKNEGLIKRIGRDIEAMRLLYLERFPPTAAVEKLSIVRVCRTKEEYHEYGGPPNSGGYWHPGNEELVFYDYSYTMKTLDDDERKLYDKHNIKLSDDDSLLVLYHEAFHQYIHYACGQFAPHDWYNEGYGDYFSGAVINDTGKLLRIEPSPWRIHTAKDMCEHGEGYIALKDILAADRPTFYNPKRARFFYAGAWSFVYFLRHAKEVAAHPQWSKLLQIYFDTMKAAYAEHYDSTNADSDLARQQMAGFMARKDAMAKMMEGIDVEALTVAWRKWVIDMRDPWPSRPCAP
jgi:hypothetical protein